MYESLYEVLKKFGVIEPQASLEKPIFFLQFFGVYSSTWIPPDGMSADRTIRRSFELFRAKFLFFKKKPLALEIDI